MEDRVSREERPGLFITFEGVEGCGKSTQAHALLEHLRSIDVPVTLSREPGGTPLGERFRQILLDTAQSDMLPLTELFLYLASRAEHTAKVVLPALLRGEVVISDRYADASVAYQGGGRGLGRETVERLNQVATGGVKPDVTFLMDLDPEEGIARLLKGRGEKARDRIESEVFEFHRMVRETYLEMAEREPARFEVIDATLSSEKIAATVARKVDGLLEGLHRDTGRQP
jgi:dTMP kinase